MTEPKLRSCIFPACLNFYEFYRVFLPLYRARLGILL